ncbi:hypothetical protein PSPO01_14862 [Paraphaeosphaeria sporulosa]
MALHDKPVRPKPPHPSSLPCTMRPCLLIDLTGIGRALTNALVWKTVIRLHFTMPRLKRTRAQTTITRPKRRAATPQSRRGDKLVARQRSLHSEDTVAEFVGEEKADFIPVEPQTEPKVEGNRSSSLSSPSSLIGPPSPWLPNRGPDRNEEVAASTDGSQMRAEKPGMETANDREKSSPSAGRGEMSAPRDRPSIPKNTTISPERRLPILLPSVSAPAPARITLPPVANVIHNPAQNYAPTSYRSTIGPVGAGPVAVATSMALAPLEQQLDLSKRITALTHGYLSPVEKNALLTIRDIRHASEGYWKTLSFMDNVAPNVPESYYKPQLQMRAAYLWARNCGMMPYPDLVRLLKLPPGFLHCWIRKYARV